ncbi:hypothetical protein BU24DRAFT_116430 [Aaosphaeria arxii CBS 175.79]|uniref:Uncharacterized protein n=1 Tax=Aaosphaeria arxii CBS 175.79 TaxID=1450172 RepID=A0A6A5Y231_9PLEO|nr:uncharacterized protein BU24DRAFT_116430 [Aaosphaeria arxii CBS 175.79]KAF2019306.1 hypothetical protein BU24DRAFT_116430 [Aaosphaeria arxii CBS 175.79]
MRQHVCAATSRDHCASRTGSFCLIAHSASSCCLKTQMKSWKLDRDRRRSMHRYNCPFPSKVPSDPEALYVHAISISPSAHQSPRLASRDSSGDVHKQKSGLSAVHSTV